MRSGIRVAESPFSSRPPVSSPRACALPAYRVSFTLPRQVRFNIGRAIFISFLAPRDSSLYRDNQADL